MIQDVLSGYNGTIFAYGQTGSGKTYTMIGTLHDEEKKGLIPRAANQIFQEIENDENETEFTIKCSLLEIYKEKLRDLLEVELVDLQIKECPRKGIYVKGLTEVYVTCEEELLDLLSLGQHLRTVASTRLNTSSSRSHFIFFLEVVQKLANDCEKRGILNLVDLAGSEKINDSGVTGNNLEEAKKINLSLSALGKVINSLIHGHEHIPYRESKLTRLLQESLGGNFKTTLLVTCSSIERFKNETLDALKFAVRAKAIRNKAKINVKNPPDNYIKMIELLKTELVSAKKEIKQLKFNKNLATLEKKRSNRNKSLIKSGPAKPPSFPQTKKGKLYEEPFAFIKNIQTGNTNSLNSSVSSLLQNTQERSFESNSESFCISPLKSSLINTEDECLDSLIPEKNESLSNLISLCAAKDNEIEKLKGTVSLLKSEKEYLESKIEELEKKIVSGRCKQLILEQKAHENYHSSYESVNLYQKDLKENALMKSKITGLEKEIKKLIVCLEDQENKHKADFEEFLNFKENTVLEFKEDPFNKNYRSDIPVMTHQSEETQSISFGSFFLSCNPIHLRNKYIENLKKGLEDSEYLSKDITIYILKQQLLKAAVTNSELTSSITSLN